MANFNTRLTKQQIITALTKALESMSEQEVQSAISTAVSGKQDILSFDNTPTSDSSNPVTSGGIHDDQQRQETEIGAVAAMGAKNILTPTLTSESTKEGITCTPNPDGTFTLNGTFPSTSSKTSVYFVVVDNEKIKELINKYGAINVICSGGSDIERSQGRLRFYKIGTNEDTYDSSATDKERALTLSDNIMDSSANIAIVVYRGQTLNNVVIRPMIRRAEITDSTFQPYAPTNRELYETKVTMEGIYDIKNQLPNGTDLNNLTAGCMTCPGATVAASLLNCPTTTDAFIIYTDYLAASSRVIQRIYSFSTTTGIPAQYVRARWSQGWTPWYQVTMQQVASASTQSVNQVSTLNLSRNDLNEQLDTNFDLIDSIPEERR